MSERRRIVSNLYVQVRIAIAVGVAFGFLDPARGCHEAVRRRVHQAREDVDRTGVKALVCFEVVSSLALVIGLIVVRTLKAGAGVGLDPAAADVGAIASYTAGAQHLSTVEFLLNVIPDTIVGACARGDVLPVLFFSRARFWMDRSRSKSTPRLSCWMR